MLTSADPPQVPQHNHSDYRRGVGGDGARGGEGRVHALAAAAERHLVWRLQMGVTLPAP